MVRRNCRPIPSTAPTPALLAHFSPYTWATALLTDASITPFALPSRNCNVPQRHTLLGRTLNTAATIPFIQGLYRPPNSAHPHGEFLWVLSLGTDLNAHEGYLHGGLLGLFVDQIMGECAHCFMGNEATRPEDELFDEGGAPLDGTMALTIEAKIRYRRPVLTPSVVLVRASMDPKSFVPVKGKMGKKMWVKASVEDGEGGIFADAESFWLEVKGLRASL